MANRHSNKRLRRLVRQRMAETGESHQKALAALLRELDERELPHDAARPLPQDAAGRRPRSAAPASSAEPRAIARGSLARRPVDRTTVDLIEARYFGWPITLAVFEAASPVGHPVIMRIPSSHDEGALARMPLPLMSFRQAGCQ